MAKLLILLLSGLKFGKLLTTGGTMLLSVMAYAFVFGWRYAAGFVVLLFIHEMGHYVAARQRGLAVGAPTFIPFVGAWIDLKEQPMDVETEAYIGLASPVAGTVGAMLCYGLARWTDSQLLLALAYAGCFLNLFNLIPLAPFDGGRITAVLSPRIWFLGVPVLVALFVWRMSPILVLMAILAVPQLMKAWRYDPDAPENRAYYSISAEARLTFTVYYLGLVVFLAMMTHELHGMLETIRPAG
ncbi:site-2 protease family protein [Ralstonia nicotianae]|uniref:site-2 protease family protein n=1 Tax=Ralstonia pseudosolanacearum TaxID=1310165 RepID=UPI0002C0F5A4|nr:MULTISPECIES: site-2 protease family protein [Ralstonia]ANH32203.1 Membrane metalloprotease [Ralstonia solanacearum]AGH84983.1 Membrane metalloprotease [Ralstonia pseudosolanacearum FQY_4]MDO3517184.1 site-2 protease family protein [Ralstonia pseudosolanacearum]MDO3544587.1 site-2 protease family protein [Ralstonia pseudosolanacearum]OAI67128.1 peptidase M50 [Ralstonia pseudosolanacearum]